MFNRSSVGTSNRWELKHSVLDIFSILCMISVSTDIQIQSFQALVVSMETLSTHLKFTFSVWEGQPIRGNLA